MAKKHKTGMCVYCGNVRPVHRDHIPPESFFASPLPSDLITVPACRQCNGGASKDDEYARLTIALRQDVADDPQVKGGVLQKAMRSLQHGAGLRHLFSQSMRQVVLRTPAGIHAGTAPGYIADLPRLSRLFNRMVRGLYFHEREEILGDEYAVESWEESGIDWDTMPADTLRAFRETIATLWRQTERCCGNGAFSYRCSFTNDDPRVSAWLLVFYGHVHVVAITASLRTAENHHERAVESRERV